MRRELLLGSACAALLMAVPAAATAHDRNHDGLPDNWEHSHGLSLKVNQANRDQDHDGMTNKQEFRFGFNPRQADSNSDGVPDSQENAGTIVSFTNGVLTLKLADGSTMTGAVTPQTQIDCQPAPTTTPTTTTAKARHDGGGDNQSSQVNGPSSNGDQGDQNDQGDDNESDDGNGNCTTAALVAGKTVHQAELSATSTGSVFREVDVVG